MQGLTPIFIFFSIIPLGIWLYFDMLRMIRPTGSLKRGIPIWKEQFDPKLVEKLKAVQVDRIETGTFLFWTVNKFFILTDESQRLINPYRKRFSTSWPIVGFVESADDFNVIEYLIVPDLCHHAFQGRAVLL